MAGRVFGRLTVVDRASERGSKKVVYSCRCGCGNTKNIAARNLYSGATKSCGCLYAEIKTQLVKLGEENRAAKKAAAQARVAARPAPIANHPLYHTWNSAIHRCHSTTNRKYKYYGARGVTVCERWKNNFWAFVADMGERPEGTTLDRIDPFGNYEPDNCRWADTALQAGNRRQPRVTAMVVLRGQEGTVAAACRKLSVDYDRVMQKIRSGVTPEMAVVSAWYRKKRFLEDGGKRGYDDCDEQARKFLGLLEGDV